MKLDGTITVMASAGTRVASMLFVLLASASAWAHPLAPALLQLTEKGDGTVEVVWKTSRSRVPGSNAQPHLPVGCTLVGEPYAAQEGSSIVTRWQLRCPNPLVGQRVGVEDLGSARIDALLRVRLADGRVVNEVLRAGSDTIVVPERPQRADVFVSYFRLGVEHILTGFDHLLFVFGLLLLVAGVRALIATVTAFTIGHSITLSLAVLGYTDFPSGPIEVLIAFSIYVLAVELARGDETATLMRRLPWAVSGLFGLLHGLGFAGALSEVGLPSDEIPIALVSFNLGIEAGQLTFVALVLLLGLALRRLPITLPRGVRWVPVYTMGALAAYWTFERLAGLS